MIPNNEAECFCAMRRDLNASFVNLIRSGEATRDDLENEIEATRTALVSLLALTWGSNAA